MAITPQYPLNIAPGGDNKQSGFTKVKNEFTYLYNWLTGKIASTTGHQHRQDVADDGGPIDATDVVNTPAGNIAAITVQAAIDELDTEKEAALGNPSSDGLALISTAAGVRSWGTAGLQAASSAEVAAGTSNTVAMTPLTNQKITIIQDQKTQNTAGGTFTAGAWRTRDLNTYQVNQIGLSALSSNQFVLSAGTYEILAFVPALHVETHQAKLYNITDSSDAILGESTLAASTSSQTTHSVISGVITLAASKTFEIRHYCTGTYATYGYGYPVNLTTEVYTKVIVRKVA